MIWKPLKHPMIVDGYLISNNGYVRNKDCDESDYLTADYHSSNGYDFIMLIVKEKYIINNSLFMLFPIDELLGITFISIPKELKDKPITIKHINGDTRDVDLSNLEWIEDIEEWRDCTYPGVKPGIYEVSSWGRVRNKKTGIIHNGFVDKDGYIRYYFGIKPFKNISGHRLIVYQFQNTPNNFISNNIPVNHLNGIKSDNYVKNLEIISVKENNKHALLTKLRTGICGDKSHLTKYSNDEIHNICKCIVICKGNMNDIINMYYKIYGKMINKYLLKHILYQESWISISKLYFNKYDIQKWKSTIAAHEEPKVKVDRSAFKK